jgi:hypothetical protein
MPRQVRSILLVTIAATTVFWGGTQGFCAEKTAESQPATKPPADSKPESSAAKAKAAAPTSKSVVAALRIEMLDRAGKPVPKLDLAARVREEFPSPAEEAVSHPLTTDAQGQALIEGLKPARYRIEVRWQGWFSEWGTTGSVAYLQLGGGLNRLQFVLTRPATIAGRVESAEGKPLGYVPITPVVDRGQGVSGTVAYLDQANSKGRSRSILADDEGRFTVDGLAEGSYFLVARSATQGPLCSGPWRVGEGQKMELAKPLAVQPAASVLGRLSVGVISDGERPTRRQEILLVAKPFSVPATVAASVSGEKFCLGPADDKGRVTVDRLLPGRYYVQVCREGSPPVSYEDVEITAGKTTMLEGRKPSPGGTIAGRLRVPPSRRIVAAHVDALAIADPDVRRRLGRTAWWVPQYLRLNEPDDAGPKIPQRAAQWRQPPSAWVDENGSYRIAGAPPGDYVLKLDIGRDLVGLVGGVRVAEARTSQAAELVLPPEKTDVQKQPELAGRVTLPKDKSIAACDIGLVTTEGEADIILEKDGLFHTREALTAKPELLFVRHPDCRLVAMDLQAAELDLSDLQLKLELKTYGKLRVRVQDAAGRPVPNVTVVPLGGANLAATVAFAGLKHAATTDADGLARLVGLATGLRSLDVLSNDFYLPAPAEAKVRPDAEVEVTIVVQPRTVLEGRLELPPGTDSARVLVELTLPREDLRDYFWTVTTGLDAEGRFRFTGLRPGKARLAIRYPDLVLDGSGQVEIAAGSPPVELKAVRTCTLALDLGKPWAGAAAEWTAPDAWNPQRPDLRPRQAVFGDTSTRADSQGRADLRGLRPGSQDLLLTLPSSRLFPGNAPGITATNVLPGVKVDLPAEGAAHAEPLRPALPVGEGQVTGRFVPPDWRFPGQVSRLDLVLVGQNCWTAVRAGGGLAMRLPAPVEAGQFPSDVFVLRPGRFTVGGLVPGEYRLFFRLRAWDPAATVEVLGEELVYELIPPDRPLRTVKVEKDRTTDAADVAVELPEAVLAKLQAIRDASRRDRLLWLGRRFGSPQGEVKDEDLTAKE